MQYYQLAPGDRERPALDLYPPVATVYHDSLHFYYGSNSAGTPHPRVHPDYYAGFMDFWLRIETAGEHEFRLRVDDTVWMWIDGWQETPADDTLSAEELAARPITGAHPLEDTLSAEELTVRPITSVRPVDAVC